MNMPKKPQERLSMTSLLAKVLTPGLLFVGGALIAHGLFSGDILQVHGGAFAWMLGFFLLNVWD